MTTINTPEQGSELLLSASGNVGGSTQFMTLTTYSQFDPWRKKWASWLGSHLKFVLDRLWPEGQIVQLHDIQTGQLLHRLTYPKEVSGDSFPHPSGQSLAMCKWDSVSMWDFYPASRWIPTGGLVVGILFSTLLALRLLRRKTTSLQPVLSTSSPT